MKESSGRSTGTLFRLNVQPQQAFAHPQWQRALQGATNALRTGKSVVLVGLPGTSKTLLLQNLAQILREEGFSVRLAGHADALDQEEGRAILLVDEAGSMPTTDLANVYTRDDPFVLVALPEFAEQLAALDCAFVPVALEPLQSDDVARYVAASLAAAGEPADMLEPDAIQALADRSQGLLRVVNALGAGAVFLRDMEGASHVTQRHVEEAYLLRQGTVAQVEPAGIRPVRTAVLSGTKIQPSLADAPSAGPEFRTEPGAPVGSVEPYSPKLFASRGQQEQGRQGSTRGSINAEVPCAPAAMTTFPFSVPRVDAAARPASSSSLAGRHAAGQRRAKLLGSLSVGLVVALLGGLVVLERVPPEERSQPAGAGSILASAAPRTLDTTTAPASAPGPLLVPSEAPGVPDSGPPGTPELSPPRHGQAMTAQAGSGTLASPADARPVRKIWRTDVEGIFAFRGAVFNETIGQGGRLMLTVRQGPGRTVTIRFEASEGLVGAGQLVGNLAQDGRITASGTLMMGRNPHECELTGIITNTGLIGAATFQRSATTTKARSTFNLIRA